MSSFDLHAVTSLICPPVCPGCALRLSGKAGVCSECEDELSSRSTIQLAAIDELLSKVDPSQRAICVGPYDGVLKRVVISLKSRPDRRLIGLMTRLLRQSATGSEGDVTCPARKPSMVTWPPSSPSRLKREGFDHGRLLGASLARDLGVGHERLLTRASAVTGQHLLKAADRRAILVEALQVRRRTRSRVKGHNVLVVDDVRTTGATLEACCEALLRAGATGVTTAVLAVTLKRERNACSH